VRKRDAGNVMASGESSVAMGRMSNERHLLQRAHGHRRNSRLRLKCKHTSDKTNLSIGTKR